MMIGFLLSHTALNLVMFLIVIVGSQSLLKCVPYAAIRYFVFTPLLGIATVALCFNAVLNANSLVDVILNVNVHSPSFMESVEPGKISRLSSFLYVFSNLSLESLLNMALMIVGISLIGLILTRAFAITENKKAASFCVLMPALLIFLGALSMKGYSSHAGNTTISAPSVSHSVATPIAPPKTLTPKPLAPPALPLMPPETLPHSLHAEKNPMTLPNALALLLSLAASFVTVFLFFMTERKRVFPWPSSLRIFAYGMTFSVPFFFLHLLIYLSYECVAQTVIITFGCLVGNTPVGIHSFSDLFFMLGLPSVYAMIAILGAIMIARDKYAITFSGLFLLPISLTGLFLCLSAHILVRNDPNWQHQCIAPVKNSPQAFQTPKATTSFTPTSSGKKAEALPTLPAPPPKDAPEPMPSLPTHYEDNDDAMRSFIPAPSIGVVKEQSGAISTPDAQVSTIILSRKVTENSPRKTAHFAKASSENAYGYRISAHQIADGWIITYAIHARQTPLQNVPAQATLLQGSVFLPFSDDGVNISDNGTVYVRVISSDPTPSENTEAGDQALADPEPEESDVKDDPSSLDTAPKTEESAPHEEGAQDEMPKTVNPAVKDTDQQAASSGVSDPHSLLSAHEASIAPPQSQSERENQIALKHFLEEHTLGQ